MFTKKDKSKLGKHELLNGQRYLRDLYKKIPLAMVGAGVIGLFIGAISNSNAIMIIVAIIFAVGIGILLKYLITTELSEVERYLSEIEKREANAKPEKSEN